MPSPRRSFLARLAASTAAFGAALAADSAPLRAMDARNRADFTPMRHAQDDWFDGVPGKHRMFFDCISPNGAAEGLTFANNYATASKSGYGLGDADLAMVLCYRHWATPFAFNDAVWAKYGEAWSRKTGFTDPETGRAPVRNAWNARNLPGQPPNRGLTIERAVARGWHFAICDMATRAFATLAVQPGGPSADDIYAELKQSTLGNAHFVAAGIVAVDRAQERGYSFSFVG